MSTDPPPITTTYPSVTAHLTDTTSVPLISTSTSNSATSALNRLATTFLASNETMSRLGLGAPLRVTASTRSGWQVTQSFLPSPPGAEESGDETAREQSIAPPALVVTVVAHRSGNAEEAARARKDLESAGALVQERWGDYHDQDDHQGEGAQ